MVRQSGIASWNPKWVIMELWTLAIHIPYETWLKYSTPVWEEEVIIVSALVEEGC
jgi:hypothetical protein